MSLNPEGVFVISQDGTKIWADASGNPSNPAVVFIHGYCCTADFFEKQVTDSKLLERVYMVRYSNFRVTLGCFENANSSIDTI